MFTIKHITKYTYSSPAIDCTNQLMLYPITDTLQTVLSHDIKITGDPAIEIFVDYFGNKLGVFSSVEPHTELVIASTATVAIVALEAPVDDQPAATQWQALKDVSGQFPNADFLQLEAFEKLDELKALIGQLFDAGKTPFENARIFSTYVYENFKYVKGITGVETSVDEIWNLKAGVCQDFAHMLLVLLRRSNIPARYVSGYICPKNHELRGEGATHAWVEAYLPYYGWIGLDPTNNCIANDRHIRLAVGRNFSDCTPVKGTYKGSSDHTLQVSVIVENGDGAGTNAGIDTLPEVFMYASPKPAPPTTDTNSYRRHMEQMQQQQQQ